MSFWNKNKLPAEYRDKTEDEIAALLAAGTNAATEAAKHKADAEAATAAKTKAEKEAADAKAALEAAQAGGGKDDDDPPERRETPKGPPNEADWLTNPNDAFSRANAATAAVAMHGAIMSARLLAEQFIQRQGPVERRLWDKYSAEIQKAVDALSPEAKIMPQTWINQFTFVKGMHLNDVIKEAQTSGDAFFSETAQSSGAGLPNDSHKNEDKLTPAEEAVAKKMGRTPEQYLAQKKKMQFTAMP